MLLLHQFEVWLEIIPIVEKQISVLLCTQLPTSPQRFISMVFSILPQIIHFKMALPLLASKQGEVRQIRKSRPSAASFCVSVHLVV